MQFHQLLDDGQAQSHSASGSPARRRPGGSLKDMRKELRRNPLAGVPDTDLDLVFASPRLHVDLPAGRREFHRIGQQVPQDLAKSVGVHANQVDGRVQIRRNRHILCRRGGLDRIERSPESSESARCHGPAAEGSRW